MLRQILIIFTLSLSTQAWSDNCELNTRLGKIARVTVKTVLDGDTFITQTGTKIRLIGINTPERNPSEPLADTATKALKKWQNQPLLIQLDKQQKDKYKRTLAHIFTENGKNISAQLLKQGLGFLISIPPNLNYQDCYLHAENTAKKHNKGVHTHPYFAPKPTLSNQLKSGFGRFYGKIESVYISKKTIWLNFNGNISLHIKRRDEKFIQGNLYKAIVKAHQEKNLARLPVIQFSGWLIDRMNFGKAMAKQIRNKKRKRFMLKIRHKNQWQITSN